MKTPLIFKIHNPNPMSLTAERVLPLLLKSNTNKLDEALTSRGEIT